MVQKRVNEIRGWRITNIGRFFARAQPDSVFSSQQLWTVDYIKEKVALVGGQTVKQIITISTSIPAEVARKVKEAWEKVFTTSVRMSSHDHKVFHSNKFKEIRRKIKNKDTALTILTNREELREIVKKLSNGTSPGPDNIPNDIIKIL